MDPSSNPTLTGLACGKPCKGSVADPFKGWYQKARHACIHASCMHTCIMQPAYFMHAPCRRWPRWASASHVAAACSAPARTTWGSTSWPTSRATHPLVYITAGHDACTGGRRCRGRGTALPAMRLHGEMGLLPTVWPYVSCRAGGCGAGDYGQRFSLRRENGLLTYNRSHGL